MNKEKNKPLMISPNLMGARHEAEYCHKGLIMVIMRLMA